MKRLIFAAALLLSLHLSAQPLATPAPPDAALEQAVGAQLPLDLPLGESDGHAVRLGDYFTADRTVLVVPGYYTCPQLCGLLMHGLLEAARAAGLGADEVRIVGISIDPQDTPETARHRLDADLGYARFLRGERRETLPDLHLLVGDAGAISRFAQAVGLRFSALNGDAASRFAHPASVIVATPQGRISRYLPGIRFDAAELRDAVKAARDARIGAPSSGLALLCAHFDPQWGRHTSLVMNGLRAVGLLLAATLAAWCWRRREIISGSRSR
ncbi:MAG TPA: SCO family protein [Ramlibacter sp.]|uniref:SCO family protein n=1 Tax=Ramlibacter sp. TaxID=1917967 RepID=UPI002BBFE35D|nr:SCO family protein [Ramlibacter sp.]HVZ46319.1 SCO family protein [Ramlibacter sp.]